MKKKDTIKQTLSYLKVVRENANAELVKNTANTETIHALRVGLRRLAVQLEILHHLGDFSFLAAIEPPLKLLRKEAGVARDLDILIERYSKVASLSRNNNKIRPEKLLLDVMEPKRKEAHLLLAESLKLLEEAKFWDKIELFISCELKPRHEKRSIQKITKQILETSFKKFHRDAKKFTNTPNLERLHALRIAAKKLRYLLENMRDSFGNKRHVKLIQKLKALQDFLGEICDDNTILKVIQRGPFPHPQP